MQLSICVFLTPSSNKRVPCFLSISMALAEHQQQWEDYVSERIVVGAVKAIKCRTARDDETDRLERFKRRRLTYKTCTSVPSPDGLMASLGTKISTWQTWYSWCFCLRCKSVFPNPLASEHFGDKQTSPAVESCASCTGPYVVPTHDEVPLLLRHLNIEEVLALRPFTLHQGPYLRPHAQGLRSHAALTVLKWKEITVESDIQKLAAARRPRAQAAYTFLRTTCPEYDEFMKQHAQILEDDAAGKALSMSSLINSKVK